MAYVIFRFYKENIFYFRAHPIFVGILCISFGESVRESTKTASLLSSAACAKIADVMTLAVKRRTKDAREKVEIGAAKSKPQLCLFTTPNPLNPQGLFTTMRGPILTPGLVQANRRIYLPLYRQQQI